MHCDCAWEEAVVLVVQILRVGIRDRGTDLRIDRRKGSPIQAVHRFYAI